MTTIINASPVFSIFEPNDLIHDKEYILCNESDNMYGGFVCKKDGDNPVTVLVGSREKIQILDPDDAKTASYLESRELVPRVASKHEVALICKSELEDDEEVIDWFKRNTVFVAFDVSKDHQIIYAIKCTWGRLTDNTEHVANNLSKYHIQYGVVTGGNINNDYDDSDVDISDLKV